MLVETLTEDARAVLAFIRDYPGVTDVELARKLGIDRDRVMTATIQLIRNNLIERHFGETKRAELPDIEPNFVTYHPA